MSGGSGGGYKQIILVCIGPVLIYEVCHKSSKTEVAIIF